MSTDEERKALYHAEIAKAMNARKAKRLEEALSRKEIGDLGSGDRIVALLKQGLLDNLRVLYATHRKMDVLPGVLVFVHIFSDFGSGCCTYSIPKMAKFLSRSQEAVRGALKRGVEAGVLARRMQSAGGRYSHWPVVFRGILDPASHTTWFVDAAVNPNTTPQGSLGGSHPPRQPGESPQGALGGPPKTSGDIVSTVKTQDRISKEKIALSVDAGGKGSPPLAAKAGAEVKPNEAVLAKRQTKAYTRDFDAFWDAYPDVHNNSKAQAFAQWNSTSAEDRLAATIGLDGYRRFLQKNPKHFVMHAERYLSSRRYEGYVSEVETARRKDWECAIATYMRGDDWKPPAWRSDCPAPGTSGFPLSIENVRILVKGRRAWCALIRGYSSGDLEAEGPFNRIRPLMFENGERECLTAERKSAVERNRQAEEKAAQDRAELHERLERERETRKSEEQKQARERQSQLHACFEELRALPRLKANEDWRVAERRKEAIFKKFGA